MNGFRALAYLNVCRFRNGLRQIAQKPARLLYWVFFVFWMGFSAWTRSHRQASFFPPLSAQFAAFIAGGLLLWFGLRTFLVAKSQALPVSTTIAGAIILERTLIDERLIFFWLYAGSGARQFVALAIATLILLVNFGHNPQALTVLNATGALLLTQVAGIPSYLLARRLQIPTLALTGAIALYGASVAIAAFFAPTLVNADARFFTRLWRGDPAMTIGLYAAIAGALACSALVTDYFPELYARSGRVQAVRERLRGKRQPQATTVSVPTVSARRSPFRGPLVEIWKQLAYLRRRNGPIVMAALIAAGPFLGAIGAYFYRRDPETAILAMSSIVIVVFVVVVISSLSLAQDISKPMWWMIDGSLFFRLCVWTVAGVLPISFVVVTASVTASLLLVQPMVAAIGVLLAFVLPGAMRAIVMLSYVISPAQTDQRGPGAFVRMLLIYLSFGISAGLGVLVAFALSSVIAGILAGLTMFGVIGALAILLASRRLAGRGIEIALMEAT